MTKRTYCRHRCLTAIIVWIAGFLAASAALAVPIAPGDTDVALGGTTVAANPDLAGVIQSDPLHPFEIRDNLNNVILTGNLQDRVARSDNTGTLIFEPRLRDLVNPAGGPTTWITGIEIAGYDGFATDIDFRTDGLGDVGADRVSRSADGNELFFSYGTSLIVPPDEALFLSAFTDATRFAPIGTATIFAQNDFGADVFSVTVEGINVPVPEPSAVVLLAMGAVAVASRQLRRKRLAALLLVAFLSVHLAGRAQADVNLVARVCDPIRANCWELTPILAPEQFLIPVSPIPEPFPPLSNLPPGTPPFIEIFDIPDLDLVNLKPVPCFLPQMRLYGDPSPMPSLVDDPNLPNLLLIYVGPDEIDGPAKLDAFELDLPPDITRLQFFAQAFDALGNPVSNIGFIQVPESASLALCVMGLLAVGLHRTCRRSSKSSTAPELPWEHEPCSSSKLKK